MFSEVHLYIRVRNDSPTILQNVLSLVVHNFVYLAAFECNTTSDWLNHSREHHSSFPPKFCTFECNTASDWLNRMVNTDPDLEIDFVTDEQVFIYGNWFK